MSQSATVPSPCVAICRLDEGNICTGCGRSLDEIARWRSMTDQQRGTVLARLAARNEGPAEG